MVVLLRFVFPADPAKVTFTPTVQYLPFRLGGVVQCYIKANPPLQYVTWTKDKRLLEPYQTKDIIVMNNGSLLFTRVSIQGSGLRRKLVGQCCKFVMMCVLFALNRLTKIIKGGILALRIMRKVPKAHPAIWKCW